MSKFKFKMNRDKWIILICTGLLLMLAAYPGFWPGSSEQTLANNAASKGSPSDRAWQIFQNGSQASAPAPDAAPSDAAAPAAVSAQFGSYEQQLEQRVRDLLKSVEGVGEVDVMIVLKSSEEKIYRVDTNLNTALTEETDASGGTRKIDNREKGESTIITGSGDGAAPILEKEMKPEISGIIISADGGGSPKIQAEISSAMVALFDLPAHKIKVLKRAE